MSNGLIGISTAESGRFSAFYASLFGLKHTGTVSITFARGADIAFNRNRITQEALDRKVDWILYLDDDHILYPGILDKLLAHKLDVVSAHYVERQPPFYSVARDGFVPGKGFYYKALRKDERGVIEVDVVGAGCLLVTRQVIEALTPPYWRLGQISPDAWGDDMDFCNRVREAGFTVNLDLETPIGHIMNGVITPEYDETYGWVTQYRHDPHQAPIATWKMPEPEPL